jgi:hypothetical protein
LRLPMPAADVAAAFVAAVTVVRAAFVPAMTVLVTCIAAAPDSRRSSTPLGSPRGVLCADRDKGALPTAAAHATAWISLQLMAASATDRCQGTTSRWAGMSAPCHSNTPVGGPS